MKTAVRKKIPLDGAYRFAKIKPATLKVPAPSSYEFINGDFRFLPASASSPTPWPFA